MRWERNLVQLEGEMVDSAIEEKLGRTGRRDGGLCNGRETWYNWKEKWWTVRWKRNVVQLEGEMVDCAIDEAVSSGRETWYNRKKRGWTVRWERNLVLDSIR